MKPSSESQPYITSWRVAGLGGLECFRAQALTHHYGRHSHEGYALGVIEAGVGGNHYRGGLHFIPAGQIVLMNPDEAHTGYAAGNQPLTYRMFYLNSSLFQEILPNRASLPYFHELCLKDDLWAGRLRRLHSLLETGALALEQQTHFIETFTALAGTYGRSPLPEAAAYEPGAIRQVKAFLQAHYRQNITLEELAQQVHFSRAYLIRAFRRATGIPPYTYLLQLRIEQAKQLLARGLPPAYIAQEVGFTDQSHLTRHFKSFTALTPKQYAIGHHRTSHT
jgi:AraC-like DNA-binding protein